MQRPTQAAQPGLLYLSASRDAALVLSAVPCLQAVPRERADIAVAIASSPVASGTGTTGSVLGASGKLTGSALRVSGTSGCNSQHVDYIRRYRRSNQKGLRRRSSQS